MRTIAELSVPRLTSALANRVIYAEALGHSVRALETKRTGPAAEETQAHAAEVTMIIKREAVHIAGATCVFVTDW